MYEVFFAKMSSCMKFQKEFIEFQNLLNAAAKIIIISHFSPDADSIGSNLALRQIIKNYSKKYAVSACVDKIPEHSGFLCGARDFAQDFNPEEFDLYITVDCGDHKMIKFHEKYPQILAKNKPLINIDHHASNDFFGTLNIVDENAASTTHLIFYFIKFLGIPLTPEIATCILSGLYYDTGGFLHSNTTSEVLKIASVLSWHGADFRTIVKKQFRNMRLSQFKLWGKIFERAAVTSKKLTRSYLKSEDFADCNASFEDITGAIRYLNSIIEGRFTALLVEDGHGAIKGSFRTRDSRIDLSKLTALFGGGGHRKAAGFLMDGILDVNPEDKLLIKQ